MLLLIQNNYDCDSLGSWFWWLIAAFLLGTLLGWLLRCIIGDCSGKSEEVTSSNNTADSADWKLKYDELNKQLTVCNTSKRDLQSQLYACNAAKVTHSNSVATASAELVDSAASKGGEAAFVAPADRDNLKKVEGIGPKIEQLLFDDGIYTWLSLSKVEVSRIQNILDKAGPRYRVHNPESWPIQAKMAADGKWGELKTWQEEHKRGLM